VAEQGVIVSSSNGSGTSTSGSTQVVERPQGVNSAGEAGMAAKAIPVAAVSFVSGLVGLLVANLVLGPLAIILGVIGLRVDSARRARAVLGIVLGVADIAVFVLLAAHAGSHHGSLSWSFFGH
jgi:predicted lipid-binding transport protein (Tim44 family)